MPKTVRFKKYFIVFFSIVATSTLFTNCGGFSSSIKSATNSETNHGLTNPDPVMEPAIYVISGSITGLGDGKTLTLQNNKNEILVISANGEFTMQTSYYGSEIYELVLANQPEGQICSLDHSSGWFAGASDTRFQVTCKNKVFRIFLTAGFHSADWSQGFENGIVGADDFCMNDANRPADMIVAKAMIVDSNSGGYNRRACSSNLCSQGGNTEHIDWVFRPNQDYVLLDGVTVVGKTNELGLLQFPLDHNLGGSGRTYFTGMASNWQTSGFDCGSWTKTSGGNVFVGHDNGTNPIGTQFLQAFGAGLTCSSQVGLVCVEQ